MIILESINLRSWTDADADRIVEMCGDAEIAQWTTLPAPFTPADAELILARAHEMETNCSGMRRAIIGLDSNVAKVEKVLGEVVLWLPSGGRVPEPEVGFIVAAEVRGQGVAVRALDLMLAVAREHFGIKSCVAYTMAGNDSSERALAKSDAFVETSTTTERLVHGAPTRMKQWRARL